jgi:hypothetical protein
VVVDISRCGEAVLGGVVLEVWLNQSKRGWSGLSAVARLEWGGAAVRGRRGCRGWSWKGRRGAPAGVELEEATVGQGGGRRRQCSVNRGAAVSVGTKRGENRGEV